MITIHTTNLTNNFTFLITVNDCRIFKLYKFLGEENETFLTSSTVISRSLAEMTKNLLFLTILEKKKLPPFCSDGYIRRSRGANLCVVDQADFMGGAFYSSDRIRNSNNSLMKRTVLSDCIKL
jgi:hypothetical protein